VNPNRILAIDVGAGTQDILLWEAGQPVENNVVQPPTSGQHPTLDWPIGEAPATECDILPSPQMIPVTLTGVNVRCIMYASFRI